MESRKLIVYIAMSLDGYITGPNEDLGFLSVVEKEGQDYGYGEFIKSVDTVIMGRRTYDKLLSMGHAFPHHDKESYIITRSNRVGTEKLKFYNGSIWSLVTGLKEGKGKNIYCDGGSEIVNELLKINLVDEMIISLIPVLLGDGIRLFKPGIPGTGLEFCNATSYGTGLVQLHYRKSDA